jgi:hypothetical protein
VHEQLLAPFQAAFKSAGWTVVREWVDSNPAYATVHYQKPGVDAWARLAFSSVSEVNLDLVETGAPKPDFTLKPPAATPEKIGAQEPFPYLTPLPGSKFLGTSGEDTGPIMVLLQGDEEQTLVAPGSVTKEYSTPPRMSTLYFVTLYRTSGREHRRRAAHRQGLRPRPTGGGQRDRRGPRQEPPRGAGTAPLQVS